MSLIGLLIVCVIVGAVLYLLQLLPIDTTMKQIIKVIVIVVLVIYVILFLASLMGWSTGGADLRIR
jgi:hypothetical protein